MLTVGILRISRLFVVSTLVCLATSQIASAGTDPGYIYVEPSSVSFFQWVDNGGIITGQLHTATLASDNQVSSQVSSFSGQISGSAININFGQSIFGTGTTIVGSVNASQLTLNISNSAGYIVKTRFSRASVDDYNAAVARLQSVAYSARVEAAQAAAAQQAESEREQALQQMRDAVSNASSDLAGTLTDLQSGESSALREATFDQDYRDYQANLADMDRDFQSAQKDASVVPFTCADLGTVNADVGSVDADLGSVHADDGSYTAHKSSIAIDVQQLDRDLDSANVQLVALRTAVDNDTSGIVPDHISGLDASRAISVAQQTLKMVSDRLKLADQKIQAFDQQAQKQDDQAHAFANALKC